MSVNSICWNCENVIPPNLFLCQKCNKIQPPKEVDEFKLTNLPHVQGKFVDAPYVKDSPAALECEYWKTVDIPGADRECGKGTYVIFGKVVGVFIDDEFIIDVVFNASKARPLVRLGYMNYGVVDRILYTYLHLYQVLFFPMELNEQLDIVLMHKKILQMHF